MKSFKFRRSPYGGVMVTRDGVDWHVLPVKRGAPSSYASTAHWQAAKGGSWQVVAVPAGAPVGGYHQQAWPFNDGATARAAALALPAPAFARGPRSNPHKPFKFHEHPRMSFRNRETGEAPTLAEWAEMVARAHQIIDDYRYRSPEQLEWAAKVDPAYYADVVVLAAYNAPSKKNPDPARAQILKPLFGAGRKLVRAVNRGAGPDVEGALLARARAAAQEADARGLPGSRILRAMLKEMQSRQVGIWRNPVAVPVGQGLIINSSKRR